MKQKKDMRECALNLLKGMSEQERFGEQDSLNSQIENTLTGDVQIISFYISQEWEVSTREMIEKAIAMGKTVACPRVDGPGKLKHYKIDHLEQCKLSKWGILEPDSNNALEIQPENFDLVFVPGLAFTLEGLRLGYGGGYYDRFLKRVKGVKIGLSFKKQLFLELPVENHDVQLDLVLFPDTASETAIIGIAQKP